MYGTVEELVAAVSKGEHVKYLFFWGHTSTRDSVGAECLSQWYEAPFVVDGVHYRTAEHFMMAEKARLFSDQSMAARIVEARSPGEAKRLGREVRGFNEEAWRRARFDIVVRGNEAKFKQNPELGEFLRNTNTQVLVEASPQDRIWGIGLERSAEGADNPRLWKGLNLLGFALMEVRNRL